MQKNRRKKEMEEVKIYLKLVDKREDERNEKVTIDVSSQKGRSRVR